MNEAEEDDKKKFRQGYGGVIYGPRNLIVCHINITGMTISDAQRTSAAFIRALEDEFPE
jgi:hypothetical protein